MGCKCRLASFGGAGGQHACEIAQLLGIKTILIHRYSSILSAYGLALADRYDTSSSPSPSPHFFRNPQHSANCLTIWHFLQCTRNPRTLLDELHPRQHPNPSIPSRQPHQKRTLRTHQTGLRALPYPNRTHAQYEVRRDGHRAHGPSLRRAWRNNW